MQIRYLIVLPLLCWAFSVHAQIGQETSSAMPAEQWEMSLDLIKTKARNLVVENSGLQVENHQLLSQEAELQRAIEEEQIKIQKTESDLAQRHGRSVQQLRIDELTAMIRSKKQVMGRLDEELARLQRRNDDLDRKIEQLKYTISGFDLNRRGQAFSTDHSQDRIPSEASLAALRTKLEEEKGLETALVGQVADMTWNRAPNVDVASIEEQNRQLEARLEGLRLEQSRHAKVGSGNGRQPEANARKYEQLKKRKLALEGAISAYEARLDNLRDSSLMAFSWNMKKKKLVHTMVTIDARNNQLRGKIKELHEDIDVLRDQVAKLERRVNFAKGRS